MRKAKESPPSLHADWSRGFKRRGIDVKIRDAPLGYYFEVVTLGFGAMPEYGTQIGLDDRWAICVAYKFLGTSDHDLGSGVTMDGSFTHSLLATLTYKF